jgi:hypothetical protein
MIPKLLFAMGVVAFAAIGAPTIERLNAEFSADVFTGLTEAKFAASAAIDAAHRQVHDLQHFLTNSGYYDVTFLLSGR